MRLILDCNVHRLAAASELWEHHDELAMWGPHIVGLRKLRLGRKVGTFKPAFMAEFAFVAPLAEAAEDRGIQFIEYWLVSHERLSIGASVDWMKRDIDAMFTKTWLNVSPSPEITRGQGYDDKQFVKDFIRSISDERLIALINAFGPKKSSQDAFHFWICEKYGLDGILTLDAKLKDKVSQLSGRLRLRPKAYLPSDICTALEIQPVEQTWFECSKDPFSGHLVKLFERQATFSDRLIFKFYNVLKKLAHKSGQEFHFRIPGFVIERTTREKLPHR